MIKVLLFEDHKNFRQGLVLFLSAMEDIWLVEAIPGARDAVYLVRKHKPDVVLMDIQMHRKSGLEALVEIRQARPGAKLLMHTVFEGDDKIFQAIREVYAGGAHISPGISRKVLAMFQQQFVKSGHTFVDLPNRKREMLGCMEKGQSYKMIAANRGIRSARWPRT